MGNFQRDGAIDLADERSDYSKTGLAILDTATDNEVAPIAQPCRTVTQVTKQHCLVRKDPSEQT